MVGAFKIIFLRKQTEWQHVLLAQWIQQNKSYNIMRTWNINKSLWFLMSLCGLALMQGWPKQHVFQIISNHATSWRGMKLAEFVIEQQTNWKLGQKYVSH